GQETGLTALSIAATICLIAVARGSDDNAALFLAGLSAGLCALAREYGWIAVPIGVIALLWKRHRFKQILLFAAIAALAGGPWYARNWILTGNPFYTLSFANLPVNSVYNGILQSYRVVLGVQNWDMSDWTHVMWLVFKS